MENVDLARLVEEQGGPMYRRLEIYEDAERFADAVWEMVFTWNSFARETMGKQLVRSAASIPNNLSEGSGRGSTPEMLRFSRIARGSLCETQNGVQPAGKRNLINPDHAAKLHASAERLLKRTNAFISHLKSRT